MDLAKALKSGEAVYADGDHEAVVTREGTTFDVYEHTKGEGSVTGSGLSARETVETLVEREVPVDRGWTGKGGR